MDFLFSVLPYVYERGDSFNWELMKVTHFPRSGIRVRVCHSFIIAFLKHFGLLPYFFEAFLPGAFLGQLVVLWVSNGGGVLTTQP